MTDPMIEFKKVSKRFGDLVVLREVDLKIPKGKTTALIGPSGTGKSVLLKHIVGLLHPDSGQVIVDGVNITGASEETLFECRKKFGMLFQHAALFDSLTTGANVEFPLIHHTKLNAQERREVVEDKLRLVDLDGLYERPTAALSGGQRKRVGLARAIVMEPDIVLFDEPNSGLDPLTSDTIDDLIVRMKDALGITFVVITHDIVSAVRIADYIGMLYKGDLLAFEPTAEFIKNPNPMIQAFLKRNLTPAFPQDAG